jgi:hypothetical protein
MVFDELIVVVLYERLEVLKRGCMWKVILSAPLTANIDRKKRGELVLQFSSTKKRREECATKC